jgi:hypothetical protein
MAIDTENLDKPHIRGSIVGPTRSWVIKAYGRELYDRALKALPGEAQARLEGEILPVSWFPLDQFQQFVDVAYREARAASGESEREFNRRMVLESGQSALLKVYRLVFSLFDPKTVISRAVPVYRRVYSHGKVDVTVNERGRCQLRFSEVPDSMLPMVRRTFPYACEAVLDLAGQQLIEGKTSEERTGATTSVSFDATYQKKP